MSDQNRIAEAQAVRQSATDRSTQRPVPFHQSNGEEFSYRKPEGDGPTREPSVPSLIANYTKGLPHDESGLLVRAQDYQTFVRGIDSGDVRDFRDTPLGPDERCCEGIPQWRSRIARVGTAQRPGLAQVRAWESAGAGQTFDLEGPDAQALTMPPAPTLTSPELATEMIEVYSMALLRDVPFAAFADKSEVYTAIERLNRSAWIDTPGSRLNSAQRGRLRGPFGLKNVFRGVTPGEQEGPYISQFLLVGNQGLQNGNEVTDGMISYGAMRMDQRVRVAEPSRDYMTTWEAWLDVQNGADLRGTESYVPSEGDTDAIPFGAPFRFIATPRDLATYVHYDALYQAYLNACIIMLSEGVPFDPGLPFQLEDSFDKQQGFAQFGGPHILSLVTEVATRALKAVRFQKFNIHRRARPEAMGGLVTRYVNNDRVNIGAAGALVEALGEELLEEVAIHNRQQNQKFSDRQTDANKGFGDSYLLPMAFPEGSPMHPSYGAGHATVAGACVTILKAFFDHGYELQQTDASGQPIAYQANLDGTALEAVALDAPLTVEGELNKLASNISIGRNWAGVHYYSDYIESIRLGEQIAIGILQEQKLTYSENFSMTVPLYDGGCIHI